MQRLMESQEYAKIKRIIDASKVLTTIDKVSILSNFRNEDYNGFKKLTIQYNK